MSRDFEIKKATKYVDGVAETTVTFKNVEPEVIDEMIESIMLFDLDDEEESETYSSEDIKLPFDLDEEEDEDCIDDMTYDELLAYTKDLLKINMKQFREVVELKRTVRVLADQVSELHSMNETLLND